LFPGVTNKVTFGLLCLGHRQAEGAKAKIAFRMRRLEQIGEEGRLFDLDADDLALLSPNTRTCPVFRSSRDAVLTKAIYRRVPILLRENPEANSWDVRFLSMLHMANDSGLFRTAKELQAEGGTLDGNTFSKGQGRFLPLYEGKMFWLYNHRFGDYAAKRPDYKKNDLPQVRGDKLVSPTFLPMPQYWVDQAAVDARLSGKWSRQWLLAWRDVTGVETIRTCITSVLPRAAVGDKAPLIFSKRSTANMACLYANLCSFILDYVARQKVGRLALKYFLMKQFTVLDPNTYDAPCPWSPSETLLTWLLPRVVELTYTAWDLEHFGADCGFEGPPFRWDEERRLHLRCELDAAYFHLYLDTGDWHQVSGEPGADFAKLKEVFPTPRHAVEYVMDTFPLVRRAEEEEYGCFRTKSLILTMYDALAEASGTDQPYKTPLAPPPGDPRCRHAARDGSLAPGVVRTLADLMNAVPTTSFPLRLSEVDTGPGQPAIWTCRPLDGDSQPPDEETWIIVKHPGLLRGSTPVPIAAGRLALNPIADGMEVLLKGATPPARLRLSADEWNAFRPLAVLEPATQRE
jgi:hypothetical protein